jgi:hypothetical protein
LSAQAGSDASASGNAASSGVISKLALLRRKYDGQEAPAPSSVSVLHSALLSEMCEALELCEDALAELSRLDDGTCSTSALFAARDVLAKARLRPG